MVTDPKVKSKVVFNFTHDIATENLASIRARRAAGVKEMVAFVRNVSLSLSGYRAPADPAPRPFSLGNQKDFDGAFANVTEARKVVLTSEGQCIVPTVYYLPPTATPATPAPTVLLLANKNGAALGSELTALVDALAGAGFVVAVPDLCGLGEAGNAFTTTSFGKGAGGCEQMASELGRSVPGMHAADVQRAASFVSGLAEVSGIYATLARDQLTTATLLASFLGAARPPLGRIGMLSPVSSFSESAVCLRDQAPDRSSTEPALQSPPDRARLAESA